MKLPPTGPARRAWAAQHVRPCWIDVDERGRRVVLEAPDITSFKREWFEEHDMADMFRPDGEVWLLSLIHI